MNSCKTLLTRAYNICSSWKLISAEFDFLGKYFNENFYPSNTFHSTVNEFLWSKFHPRTKSPTVPKLERYVSLPYIGHHTKLFKREILKSVSRVVPFIDLRLIFSNQKKIQSCFKFKDSLLPSLRSDVVYKFTCSGCKPESGTSYIGSTRRLLRVRMAEHLRISHKTLAPGKKPHTAVSEHHLVTAHVTKFEDFKIIASSKSSSDLYLIESLLIKEHQPNLNKDIASTPLYIA